MADNDQTLKRFKELSIRAQRSGSFVYTSFHSPSGAALAFQAAADAEIKMYGGMEGCERVVIRFGDPEQTGYEEDFPIVSVRTVMWALRMKPLPKEFWEEYF